MLDILAITGPIYLSIAAGYLATRFGFFARTDRQVFGKFVINLAVPALLLKALAERSISEILNFDYILAYLAGTLVVIGLGLFWCRRIRRMHPTTSALCAMGMACSNSVFIGYPVLLLTLPPVAGVAMALNTTLENVVVTPLMLALAESGRAGSGRWYRVIGRSLTRLFSNPMIIGLSAGFIISLCGWKLPQPIAQTLGLFAMTTGALSLFAIGGTLVGLPMGGMVRQAVPIVIGKLILHPLAVFLSLLVLPVLGLPSVAPDLRLAAILMAAVPMLGIYPILAQMFGQEEFTATALLITTIASFFTLSGLLWVLGIVPG
ncbi:MAG: AEC family transporter [Propionivibrio sp.]